MMQEVLAKPGYEALPLAQQEFYELCIEETYDTRGRWFLVKRTHASWSEVDRRFMWDAPETERWLTLEKAQEQHGLWLEALRAKGFTQSDMDFF
jgi:hypothetical protein